MNQRGIEALNRLTHYIEQLKSERNELKAENLKLLDGFLKEKVCEPLNIMEKDRDHWCTLALAAKAALAKITRMNLVEKGKPAWFGADQMKTVAKDALAAFPPEEKKP